MSRQKLDFTVIKSKGTPYYKGKIRGWKNYRSTGETTRAKAEKVARRWFEESLVEKSYTFGQYAALFYTDGCPHCTRLEDDDHPAGSDHISHRRSIINKYILVDPICPIDLVDIRRNDFLSFRSRIHSLKLSNGMKNKITGTAKTILKEALFRELIHRDITAGIGNLREKDRKQKYIPTMEEIHSIICPGDHHESEMARVAFNLMASTGMRRSEVIALRWDRIEENSLHINLALKASGKRGVKSHYDLPKKGISRIIPLPPIMKEILNRHPRLGDFIICHTDGTPYSRKWVNQNLDKITENLGIDKQNFVPHSFRHFLNSWFLNRGYAPQHVRSYLGWSEDSDGPQNRVSRVQKGYLQIPIDKLRPMSLAISEALGWVAK